jgi:pyrroline-5-carboxylate reductase
MTMNIGFVGAGKMAAALAGGMVRKGVVAPARVRASDVSEEARQAFSAATGLRTTGDNRELVDWADTVILAVKPQVAGRVLEPLTGAFEHKLLVSIAAGLSIARLSAWTGTERIIRVMPNTPALVGKGAAVFAAGAAVLPADRDIAQRILGAVGMVLEMPESKLDAVTGVSGSGPAYVFEFVQAMIDGATAAGLEAEAARRLVLQTVSGAVEMLQRELGTPDELRTAVTSPGGTTAAGLAVLAGAGFRDLIAAVIAKATARSVELGKQ